MIVAPLVFILLPLVVANIIHQAVIVKGNFFTPLSVPLDGGGTVRGKRLFGAHKKLRGIIVVAVITSGFTELLSLVMFFPYTPHPALFGLILGGAYMLAELPNSFVKRQFGIPEGGQGVGAAGYCFAFLDHIDSVLGVSIALYLLIHPSLATLTLLIVIGGLLHYAIERLLRVVGVR